MREDSRCPNGEGVIAIGDNRRLWLYKYIGKTSDTPVLQVEWNVSSSLEGRGEHSPPRCHRKITPCGDSSDHGYIHWKRFLFAEMK
ncbi:hypothetical protein AVEN_65203-1 [Araneus ventricosus]|uniref:Uncharacterized protein n=1 Tax=Araneus ventricosus TaxID=182803 RepID=A0A4Y2AHB3_ARAVE|nr:hypothetical protein AVEN_65203-1 [Araneus ventricosus]